MTNKISIVDLLEFSFSLVFSGYKLLYFFFPFQLPFLSIKLYRFFYLKNRWYDEKVSSLELSAPLSIMPDLSVDHTIKIMNQEGFDQLPVIDELG